MAVKITGVREIIKGLDDKLGVNKTNRVVNKALRKVGDETEKILREEILTYKRTGATYEDIVKSGVKISGGIKRIEVGFGGPNQRWRLVHLNEFGYTRFGKRQNPRGMGKVQNVVDRTKPLYKEIMEKELKELLE